VTDAELLRALRYLWERMKTVVEPTGALGAAGLFERSYEVAGRRVGVILSGGNVDLESLCRLL
jgi:threonine dehydratase